MATTMTGIVSGHVHVPGTSMRRSYRRGRGTLGSPYDVRVFQTRRPPVSGLGLPGTQLARVAARLRRAAPVEWRHYVRLLPIRHNEVLYESFAGNGALCHPEAIFREVLASPDLQHLRHIWVLNDLSRYADAAAELGALRHVTVVERGSMAYYRHLATSRYLVNNATFPVTFDKRPGQVYLNTWHGTPLKHMGFDEPGGAMAAHNVLRNFLQADFVLTSGQYMTETMYEGAYRLDNIAPRLSIIDEGNPRTDRQVLDPSGRADVLERLRRAGLAVRAGAKVVLYAPTWQGESFHTPQDDAAELGRAVTELQRALPEGHVVLLKVHQQVEEFARKNPALQPVLVPNDLPTNLVLGVTDVLVTDFSSIFFDFIGTGRPVLFFTPHLDEYVQSRGVYFGADELPGPRSATIAALALRIGTIGSRDRLDPEVTHGERYAAARARFAARDDGAAASRVVDIVFRGITEGRRLSGPRQDDRTRILIYLGGMKSNGITSSALNLLHHIDERRFDVTALFDLRPGERAMNIRRIPPHVRSVARSGGFNPGKVHWFRRRRFTARGGLMRPRDLAAMLGLLEQEWHRVLGDAEFDHIVDFSGYSPFWSFLMAEGAAQTRAIWQHNDLRADQMRMVDGHRPHEKNLGSVFSSYYLYDRIVSVSPALRDINAAQLGNFAPAEKFVSARNLINATSIRAAVTGEPAVRDSWPGDHLLDCYRQDLDREARRRIWREHAAFHAEMDRRWAIAQSPRTDGVFQFVTVGRLSPEKNHERLVRAFASTHQQCPDTRLVIIGTGPLERHLHALVAELGLAGSVVLTGSLRNPWALMSECDGFLLSSDYEGQPMVILEARALSLPVVSTAFGSVAGAVEDGVDGLVVERSVEGVAAGMHALLSHEVPRPSFDPDSYNAEATQEFYAAIGVHQG